ncbi:MAG: hypothetical protein WKG00_03855 [Polyangiaceae bacterium]
MPRLVTALAAAAVALTAVGEARAGGYDLNGIWSPVGVALGGSFDGQDRGGFFVGPEASVVYLSDGVWAGGFADVVWDFGSDQLRHAIGPELGFGPFGVDFGYLGVLQDGDYREGAVQSAELVHPHPNDQAYSITELIEVGGVV